MRLDACDALARLSVPQHELAVLAPTADVGPTVRDEPAHRRAISDASVIIGSVRTHLTLLWPVYVLTTLPSITFHSRTVESSVAARTKRPFGEKRTCDLRTSVRAPTRHLRTRED